MNFNQEFDNKCSFCERAISFMPVKCFNCEHQFCDLVCAKLYYDHIENIKPDMNEYHLAYLRKQISKQAYEIYEKLSGVIFYMLPNSKGMNINDRVEAHNAYTKILLRIKEA